MEEITQEYLGMLKDSNECLKLYASHIAERDAVIKTLRAELKEQEAKLQECMARDSFTISRTDLRSFFVTVKYRHETDAEWALFERTFSFKLQDEIYKWIESLPSAREETGKALPSTREQTHDSHSSPACTLSEESRHASTLTSHTQADEESR